MNKGERKKLLYLLDFADYFIERSVHDVLADSDEDPQYSAVTTSNLIKCYIETMICMGVKINAHTEDEYLADKCFTESEIKKFVSKKELESTYYVGEQF